MPFEPRYHINVFWYADDACWIADVPDLRLCSARGATPELAMAAVCAVMERWLETARAAGQPTPEPRYSPSLCAAA